MHKLETLLRERIAAGLKRKSITSCSNWAESYRVMGQPFPGNFSFERHPWAKDMHDCKAEMMVGQKGAQLCYTETALNKTFFAIDIEGVSVMYILPASNPDASDFSTARFDPALELSPHLNNLFSDVKNIGHKRAGNANLYLRGSRSRSQLKSVPVGLMILDELDEFKQENIPLIFERMSGQTQKQSFLLSTPTIDHYGINVYFRQSTQNHFFFICPSCSKLTELSFPDCLVVCGDNWADPRISESYIKCKECDNALPPDKRFLHKTGRWVPSFTDKNIEGFYVNQLYSPTVRADELAASYLKAQTNPTDEQEFYNSKLGLTHIVEGARVTEEEIDQAIKSYTMEDAGKGLVTMGVDVGKWLHLEIDEWYFDYATTTPDLNLLAMCRVIYIHKLLHFEQLDQYMHQYNVQACVIDANPERRKALEFAKRFNGRVDLCFYANGIESKQLKINEAESTISVDRTSWLDLSLGRFHSGKIDIPRNTPEEYKRHIKALVRVYKKDKNGNPVGKYEKGFQEDHYAHARNYSEIALQRAANRVGSYSLQGVV